MVQRLSLATWTKDGAETLDDIETVIVGRLRPPLNLAKSVSPESGSGGLKAHGRSSSGLAPWRYRRLMAFR